MIKLKYLGIHHISLCLLLLFCGLVHHPFTQAQGLPNPAMTTEESESDQSSSNQQDADNTSQEGNQKEGIDLGLGELIQADEWGNTWLNKLNTTLKDYGLSQNEFGKIVAIAVISLGFLILYYILKRVVKSLLQRVEIKRLHVTINSNRMSIYRSVTNFVLMIALLSLYIMAVCGIVYEEGTEAFLYSHAASALQFGLTFIFLFAVGVLTFEIANNLIEYYLSRWSSSDSTRVQTLLPIARNFINVVLFLILGITLISELGINVMPLLAGAGVIGFAVGFGAQTLIKDLLTGFIIIFEDLIQVGDVASVGGKAGLVEKITIRKVQLRALDGVVITVPFSEISIVENLTKEFSCYVMDIGIAYREDPDEAIEIIKSIGEELYEDEKYGKLMVDHIEVMGVDAFADSAIIIKARLKTKPIKQWEVGREFNRRLKHRFDAAGIEIPFPHQTIYFGEDKAGKAPAANINVLHQSPANDAPEDSSESENSQQTDADEKKAKKDSKHAEKQDGVVERDAADSD